MEENTKVYRTRIVIAVSKPQQDQFLTRLASYSQHSSNTTLSHPILRTKLDIHYI
jgi:hypothetical protein